MGAEDGTRTRDPQLGKLMLYQLSYFRSFVTGPFRARATSILLQVFGECQEDPCRALPVHRKFQVLLSPDPGFRFLAT